MKEKRSHVTLYTFIGVGLLLILFTVGTLWIGGAARRDTDSAVRSVSLLYLDELAGRREQVVSKNLQDKINIIYTALEMMTKEDLSDEANLREYQANMKQLFTLEKFAFVDADGVIYTSQGTQTNVGDYHFSHQVLDGPDISIKDMDTERKTVIVAVPVDMTFQGKAFTVCFMEISMDEMLSGVSMAAQENGATFCNIYTADGNPLSNTVLGGLAAESNLLEALKKAELSREYNLDTVTREFREGIRGQVSFTYDGVPETLSYVPVKGTDWRLTYLIRESVISDNISSISDGILRRNLMQLAATVLILLGLFSAIIRQSRKSDRLELEKKTADVENRVKQEELSRQLALHQELLQQRKQQEEQTRMITALSSDYWSVYYLDLDRDEGVCYQSHEDLENGVRTGDRFRFSETFAEYARSYVKPEFQEAFLAFIRPENIRTLLQAQRVISHRYLVHRHDRDTWEEIRFAGVRHPEDREDHKVHIVGACFADVDAETRKAMDQTRSLQQALSAAKAANEAKTSFLSNMSHEIRTPMNAIIGLDNIALNDPDISGQTREYLEKIGASAHHLLGIINDILDVSRIESGRLVVKQEEFSFYRTLEQVNTIISGQCREKGLTYECHTKGQIDEYYIGDDMKLRQVMINILGNAVKFTPEGGKVSLLIEDAARMDNKATLRMIFTDTGIGMSREFLPKLFDVFTQEDSSSTSKYGSTGLGMAITKSIVELMNGHIEVDSEKGKGTTFTVTVTLGQSERTQDMSGDAEIHPNEMCVLVIDDDQIACEHAEVVLSQVGIGCETALSGKKALEMVRMRHARREDYNLILVDWKMPDMDGVETTKQIRAIVGSQMPIIILTSYSWDDVEQEAREAGVDTFVAKPLFARTVMDEFRAALRLKNAKLMDETADLTGRRVLLAEDVAVNAEIMLMVLSMREMKADHAENGKIAVEMFESHEPGYYDAILMDMRMPEMDGLEATRRIRASGKADAKTIPIIALTANAFDEDVQRSMQAGLNAHLSKPVEPETLFKTLEGLIK